MSANPNPNLANANIPWQQSILKGTSAYYSELAGAGVLRPAWAEFVNRLPATGLGEHLDGKKAALAKQIRDNGITYNVYADHAQGTSRPWSLDLFPLVVDAPSWQHIEAGVQQRMRLLEANGNVADQLLIVAAVTQLAGGFRLLFSVLGLGVNSLRLVFDVLEEARPAGPTRRGCPDGPWSCPPLTVDR